MSNAVPHGWSVQLLGKLADVRSSNVDKKSDASELPVRLCNYTDVYYRNRITSDIDFMHATAKQGEIDRFALEKGDVIITKDSETPDDIAVPALVSESLPGVICGYHLTLLRPKPDRSNGEFLAHLFQLQSVQHYFYLLANGTTRFGLTAEAINTAPLITPPLPEQQKIATILSSVDDVIEKTRAQIDKLKGLKTGMMQELLTKGIGHTEFKDSPVGRIPKNWKVSQIGDIAQVNPRLLNKPEMTTLVSFLRMQDVSNDAKILAKTTRKYADVCKGFTSFSDGDVLFAKITPCMENGKGAFVEGLMNGIGFGSTEFHVLRATNNDVARWLFHLLSGKQFREKAAQFMTGSAGQRRVPTDFLKMVEVAMPACNSEMRSIVSALDALDKRVTHKELHVESIQNIKKALMQDLLTGKVRVKLTDKESAAV